MTTTPAPLQIAVLVGSLRKASFNRIVADNLAPLSPSGLHLHVLPPLHDIPLYNQDHFDAGVPPAVTSLGEAIARSDGLVIVTPEYNYSVPGVLKNALDWLSRLPDKPIQHKPVALQSASMGVLGGVRAQYHLRQILVALNAMVMNTPEVVIGSVQAKVDPATRRITDADTRQFISTQLAAFEVQARRLRT